MAILKKTHLRSFAPPTLKSMKINVQIRGFMCCLSMGLNLKNTSNEPRVVNMTLYTESFANQTDHFADAFVREKVVCGYDVVTML